MAALGAWVLALAAQPGHVGAAEPLAGPRPHPHRSLCGSDQWCLPGPGTGVWGEVWTVPQETPLRSRFLFKMVIYLPLLERQRKRQAAGGESFHPAVHCPEGCTVRAGPG